MSSLKRRLTGAAVIWIIVGMVASGALLSAIFRQHVTAQFNEELFVHLDELQRLATLDGTAAHLQRQLSDPRYDVARSGYYWEIQKAGTVVARSASMQGSMLQTPADDIKDIEVHTHEIDGPTGRLVVAERAEWKSPTEQPVRFLIGTDKRHLDSVVHSFDRTLFGALGTFGVTMIAAAGLLIAFALRPLTQLRDALTEVRAGNEKSLRGRFPHEVQPLVDELNAMLTTTSELVQRARTQAGNLAHGLKTPLAVLTDEAYRIKDKGLAPSSATILDQCRRMQTQIDYQITRARAVAMRASPGTVASVAKSVGEVTSALTRLYRDRGILIESSVPDGINVACDAQDINEMLANVADNACKHAKSVVRISARPSVNHDMAEITVEDDGPGLPPEAFEVVFNIGERWDSQKPGSGLGLAIVRDLARLYGGDVSLSPSQLGGLTVTIALPIAGTRR